MRRGNEGAVMYDFYKAFNRQDHNTQITLLSDMGTPGWLLKLVTPFLENRKMVLNHKGCTSREENLLTPTKRTGFTMTTRPSS